MPVNAIVCRLFTSFAGVMQLLPGEVEKYAHLVFALLETIMVLCGMIGLLISQRKKRGDTMSELLSNRLKETIEKITTDFGSSDDLAVQYGTNAISGISYAVIYIREMADKAAVDAISKELIQTKDDHKAKRSAPLFDFLLNSIALARVKNTGTDYQALYREILNGNMVMLVDGDGRFLAIGTGSDEGRAISEPTSQTIIKGPKDAFTENIDKNVYLIRSRIRNESLRVESITIGTETRTKVKLLYLDGIAKKDIVDDLRSRVIKIDYDGIISSSYIEEIIKTDPYSIFPTTLSSERPDQAAASLLEGRVIIISDGSPYVVAAPVLISDFLQASDDYYENFYIASLMRLIRHFALFFTLLIPAAYIALITIHQEIIPTPLLISIAAQREGVPFPALLEVLIMELTFEILREAGVRMPRAIGSAISIVGALVLGQAAVEAGLVAAATVIVVALTAISSFAITNYAMSNAIRILRFVFIFLAGTFGLYGISMGLIILLLHLCKVKSASVPYLMPYAPFMKRGIKDTIVRFPLLSLKYRPAGISATRAPRTNGRNTMDPEIKKKPEVR
jgi:spore germination protein KA